MGGDAGGRDRQGTPSPGLKLPPPLFLTEPLGPPPAGPAAGLGGAPGDGLEPPLEPPLEEQPTLGIGPDEVTGLIVTVGDILGKVRGPHWRVEPDECELVSPPLARQLNRTDADSPLARWVLQHSDALLIAVGAAAIVVPRAAIEYRVIQYRREQAARAEQEGRDGYQGEASGDAGAGLPRERTGDGRGARATVGPRETDPVALAAAAAAITRR